LLDLGRHRAAAFAPDAVEILTNAHRQARDADARATSLLEKARALAAEGRIEGAIGALDEAAAERPDDREATLLMEAELIALGQMDVLPNEIVRSRVARHRAAPPAGTTPGECALLGTLAHESVRSIEPWTVAAELSRRAAQGDHLLTLRPDAPARVMTVASLRSTEQLETAERLAQSGLSGARALGSDSAFVAACFQLANNARARGDVLGIQEQCADLLAAAPTEHPLRPYAAGLSAAASIDREGPAEARAFLERQGLWEQAADKILFNAVLYYRAVVATACGEAARAVSDLTTFGERELANDYPTPVGTPWRAAMALAHVQLGERERALHECDQDLALTRQFGAPRWLGIVLRARGLLEQGDGAIEMLKEAVDLLERSPDRLEHARAMIDVGAALRRAKKRRDARTPLTEGSDLAARCGALALAERGLTELRALGARPRNVFISGPDALTASERRIAEMAGGGMSNPEIAQALFVTRKTVENHLSRIYPKLNIHSRDELPAALSKAHVRPAGTGRPTNS
jgi:DNA-binding CsgD family transcriptional regulator